MKSSKCCIAEQKIVYLSFILPSKVILKPLNFPRPEGSQMLALVIQLLLLHMLFMIKIRNKIVHFCSLPATCRLVTQY